MTHRSVEVPLIARVEGEGALHVAVDGEEITDLRLEIYEPPRFFEALLVGRRFSEVPDIVPRICGICPVAYQMSAIHGLERLFGVTPPEGTRELRRLLYCGEWIESHVLHVFLLAAPDLLGLPNAIELAKTRPDLVRMALQMKRIGNDLLATIGGREIHPVSPRVGGFWKVPGRTDLEPFLPRLRWALERVPEVAELVGSFAQPSLNRPTELVSMVHPGEYPLNEGAIASTAGRSWSFEEYETVTTELQVEHSNALHSVFANTGSPYALGPLARVNLNLDRLSPLARRCAETAGLRLPEQDPFRSMAARVAEIAFALEESIRLIEGYVPPAVPFVEATPRAGRATWATEAPRGTLYHRYDVDGDGAISAAKIVPPTSQNLRHIEADLRRFVPRILDRSDAELTRLCETLVRSYDPCISCATHFLRLDLRRS